MLVLLCFLLVPVVYLGAGCLRSQTNTGSEKIALSDELQKQYVLRPEESTYLTFSEWYIVYSAEEYAAHLKGNRPSSFPYFSAIGQYWGSYCTVTKITSAEYGFNISNHLMLYIIGQSFTVENLFKGVYENTIGRVSEWFGTPTQEDRYAQSANEEYGKFLHSVPLYEFPFHKKLCCLWTKTDLFGMGFVRKWERKIVLSLEYAVKSGYGYLIKIATKTVLGSADLEITVVTGPFSQAVLDSESRIKLIRQEQDKLLIVLPRYEAFTEIVKKEKLPFLEIAGNDEILITVLAPSNWNNFPTGTTEMFSMEILTKPESKRVALKVMVSSLSSTLTQLEKEGIQLEHVYDY